MPVCRSARARAPAASTAIGLLRQSSTTKSLPRPCILRNGILPITAAYMAAWPGLSNLPTGDRGGADALCQAFVARELVNSVPAACRRFVLAGFAVLVVALAPVKAAFLLPAVA